MRKLQGHKVNPANDRLEIEVMDAPGAGGANHVYRVTGFDAPAPKREEIPAADGSADIIFQDGPIPENGVNGLTQEVLLEICADRLRSFQAGPFACRENALALTKIEEAQMWLQKRTRDRMARNVEGTHKL
jgi:hypothetical protein